MSSKINELQLEVRDWIERNFPDSDKEDQVLLVAEESGELCHSALKMKQGIRGSELQHRADMIDAIGDIFVGLCAVCIKYGFDLDTCINDTWSKVKKRDWTNRRVEESEGKDEPKQGY